MYIVVLRVKLKKNKIFVKILIFADNFCGQNFWDKQNRKKIRKNNLKPRKNSCMVIW